MTTPDVRDLEHDSKSKSYIGIPWVTVYLPDGQTMRVIRYDHFVEKLMKKQTPELMLAHCGLGIAGEAGELADVIKRSINYERVVTAEGKPIEEGIKEEVGDCFWYLQAVMNLYKLTWQDVLQHNANKLGKRYVNLHYSDEAAHIRADKLIEKAQGE